MIATDRCQLRRTTSNAASAGPCVAACRTAIRDRAALAANDRPERLLEIGEFFNAPISDYEPDSRIKMQKSIVTNRRRNQSTHLPAFGYGPMNLSPLK